MADTMQFALVSPERSLESRLVREVRLPGSDGDLTALPGHAPVILTLRPGMVTLVGDDGRAVEFVVTGGFAEISPEGGTLLAGRGHGGEEVGQAGAWEGGVVAGDRSRGTDHQVQRDLDVDLELLG